MATNNYSEYTSLLQGYQKKRKSKKKKVIAAAALTFFKNLADKALTRDTANELAGYQSEYGKLAMDASAEYKKQEDFVNIGTQRGGGTYTYDKTDEGEDTINFQYPDKIKQSFIIDEVDSGRKLLNTQYGSTRAMNKEYVAHLTKIGEQRYQSWQDNKGAYDFSIRSESDATEGIRKALLLTAKEYKKPRYADAITNLGYKWFNKEVQNPALLELAKVTKNIESLKSSRDAKIKGIESTAFEGDKIGKLKLSMAQRVALEEAIENDKIFQETKVNEDGKTVLLNTQEQIENIDRRFSDASILQAFGFSSRDEILGHAIIPLADEGGAFVDREKSSTKKAFFNRVFTKQVDNIFTSYGIKKETIPENIQEEILNNNFEEINNLVNDPKNLKNIKLNLVDAEINSFREAYGFNSADEKVLEFAKFNIETDYLKSLKLDENVNESEYRNHLAYIKVAYKPFLNETTGAKYAIIKGQVNDTYAKMNTNEIKARSQRRLGDLDYVIGKTTDIERKEKLEEIRRSIVTTSGAEGIVDLGVLQTLDAIEKMNVVYAITDLNNEGLYPFLDNRPAAWMQDLVNSSVGKGRYTN